MCIRDRNIPAQINTTDTIVSMPKTLSPSIMPESKVPNTGTCLLYTSIKNPNIDTASVEGGERTSASFAQIPYIGTPILVVGIVLFAFSTILGWSYYAESLSLIHI